MRKLLFLILILFYSTYIFSQTKPDTVYVYFGKANQKNFKGDISQKYTFIDNYKYHKREDTERILFFINDEKFLFDKDLHRVDTCNINLLRNVPLRSLKYLSAIRVKLKSVYFFKKDVFDKIYLLEPRGDRILKYEVAWITDLLVD